jgi:glycosyltransferase involved in cell wall biosynthesis
MLTESLSVVVPVYNSKDSLPVPVQHRCALLLTIARQFELILVNDASSEGGGARTQFMRTCT